MRFAFIKAHQDDWPVGLQCRVLKVSRSGFYAWRVRPQSQRHRFQEELTEEIRKVHAECREVYGSPRIAVELKARGGIEACENTVAKAMARAGIAACRRRRFVPQTTNSNHPNPIAPNLLDREFDAKLPNQKWVCDITYIWTRDQGWLYVAAVMDLCSRRIVGWSMADHMKTELVNDALKMALATRQPGPGLLHHSDRGVQYASQDYRATLQAQGITCSMSRTGNCYDNAAMESFWSTLKREEANHQNYATHEQARQSIFEYVEVFYNRIRRHSSLGYVSPEAFEAGPN
jgi:transposase InsO family protein